MKDLMMGNNRWELEGQASSSSEEEKKVEIVFTLFGKPVTKTCDQFSSSFPPPVIQNKLFFFVSFPIFFSPQKNPRILCFRMTR